MWVSSLITCPTYLYASLRHNSNFNLLTLPRSMALHVAAATNEAELLNACKWAAA